MKSSCLSLFFLFLGCATSLGQSEDVLEAEKTIRINFSTTLTKKPQYTFYFLKHLDRWYLQLSPDHKKIVLLNAKELKVGTRIKIEEIAQGQHLKHLYTVTQFDENVGMFRMESPMTRVVIRKFFRLQNKTVLTIQLKNSGNGTYSLTSDLEIVFPSRSDKEKAVFFKADKVWQRHMNHEMTAAVTIVESLDNIMD